jgi:hypothetical protein
MMPASLSPPDQPHVMPGPATAIGGPPGAADQGDYGAEGRKAKRELSQSKRAAQNRAAQVSFSVLLCLVGWLIGCCLEITEFLSALWK